MGLVSIIIPVYNTPVKELERCLKSIIEQKYDNFEVVIVDDGSNNEIAEWLDRYTDNDNRFKVIHQRNMGVSAARNAGINNAKGNYLIFVDSDDYISEDYLLSGISYMDNNDIDVICENASSEADKSNNNADIIILDDMENMLESLLLNIIYIDGLPIKITQSPWGKIFKKSVIDNVRFSSTLKYGEDALFNSKVFVNSSRIGVVNERWYHYNINEFSAMMIDDIDKNQKFIIEHGKLMDEIFTWSKQTDNKTICDICARKVINIIDYVYGESLNFSKNKVIKKELKKILLNNNLRLALGYLRKNKSICTKKEMVMVFLCETKACNLILLKKHMKKKN